MQYHVFIKKIFLLFLATVSLSVVAAPIYFECKTPLSTFKVTLDEATKTAAYYNVDVPEHIFQGEAKFTEDRVVYSAKDTPGFSHEIDRRTLAFKMKFGPFNNGDGACQLVQPAERKF